jgi:hypothetical protein
MFITLLALACTHSTPPPSGGEAATGTFREYRVTDAASCQTVRYSCGSGEGFSDATGCGCVVPRRDAADTMCAADVEPVCATVKGGATKTVPNLCQASVLPGVTETRPGKCP